MLKERWQQLGLERRLRALYERYERVLIPGFLVLGFVFDVITFRTLNMRTTLELLAVYAGIAMLTLSYIHVYDGRHQPPRWRIYSYLRFLAPFAAQISFGALLSSSLLFYWFSGSFSVSWPLLALTTGVMVSSEIFRQFYLRPEVQLSVLNFVLLSYFSLLLPFAVHSLSGWVFFLAGMVSTFITLMMALCLAHFVTTLRSRRWPMIVSIAFVFAMMSGFYYFKLIPPVPLSIRDAGMYHDVTRQGNQYTFVEEPQTFWQKLIPGQLLHVASDDSIFAYTAIFAPAEVSTPIYHHWEYKSPTTGKWTDRGTLKFTIRGGRPDGYRGYTMKSGLQEGKWRVTVQNSRGQVLGRLLFTVERE